MKNFIEPNNEQILEERLLKNKYLLHLYNKNKEKFPFIELITNKHCINLFDFHVEYENNSNEKIYDSDYSEIILNELKNNKNPLSITHYNLRNDKKEKELNEIANALKNAYKTKGLDENFFKNFILQLNYEIDNSSFLLKDKPNCIDEIFNEIELKVQIIKTLRYFSSLNLFSRLCLNLNQIQGSDSNEDFNTIYNKFVVDDEIFVNLNYEDLCKLLINENSAKLRRKIGIENVYNYIPILCKGYCNEIAKKVFEKIPDFIEENLNFEQERLIYNDKNKNFPNKLKPCEFCHKNFCDFFHKFSNIFNDENVKKMIQEELNIIYLKTCIFSHNINECLFHPLVYHTFKNNKIYESISVDTNSRLNALNELDSINKNYKISEIINKFKNDQTKEVFNLRRIFNSLDHNIQFALAKLSHFNVFKIIEDKCFLSNIKTHECVLLQHKDYKNINEVKHDARFCTKFHKNCESRRNFNIVNNEICSECLETGKNGKLIWKKDINQIHDNDEDKKVNCQKFHTLNELLYDKRNYRKLFFCPEKEHCDRGYLCPYKHPYEIKPDEIYLPKEYQKKLKNKLKILKLNEKYIEKYNELLSKVQCLICYNKIESKYFFFKDCKHFLCYKCGVSFNACPICTNQSTKSIKIDLFLNKKNNKKIEDKKIKDLIEKNYGKINLKHNDNDDSFDENDDSIFTNNNEFKENEFNINNNTKYKNKKLQTSMLDNSEEEEEEEGEEEGEEGEENEEEDEEGENEEDQNEDENEEEEEEDN